MKSENRVDWEESLLKLLILKGNGGNVHLRVKCNKKAPFSIKTCFIINHFYKTDSTLAFQLIKLQILQTKKATFWLNLMNCCEHTSKLERFRKAIFNLQLIMVEIHWKTYLPFCVPFEGQVKLITKKHNCFLILSYRYLIKMDNTPW